MSFPRYPTYCTIDEEGLVEIPSEWRPARLGHLCTVGMGQTLLREMLDSEPSDDSLPVFSASEGDEVFGYFRNAKVRLEPGDIIVGARGSIGFARRLNSPATCTQTTIWLKPKPESVDKGFLYWNLIGGRERLFPFDKTAIPMLTVGQVRRGVIPLPDTSHQRAIAAFLDRETAKIDALVAEQRRLMDLLREQRQAVISHAVTKGLNPDAPMKDSGVEWLGEVPAHWQVLPLRRVASNILTGRTPAGGGESETAHAGEVPWYTPADFNNSIELDGSTRELREEIVASSGLPVFPANIVLMVGIGATLGKIGVTTKPCSANQQVNAVFPSGLVEARFLAFALTAQRDFVVASASSATLPILNQERTAALVVPLPPLDEQRRILDRIDSAVSEDAKVSADAERAVTLLVERRAALITAAVTGQIDVRALAVSEAA